MSSLAAQLNAAKAEGNDHFKRQEWGGAFQAYTRGIDMGLASLETTIFLGSRCESDPQPDVAALATLYGNRAAAGLKLGRLEQVSCAPPCFVKWARRRTRRLAVQRPSFRLPPVAAAVVAAISCHPVPALCLCEKSAAKATLTWAYLRSLGIQHSNQA